MRRLVLFHAILGIVSSHGVEPKQWEIIRREQDTPIYVTFAENEFLLWGHSRQLFSRRGVEWGEEDRYPIQSSNSDTAPTWRGDVWMFPGEGIRAVDENENVVIDGTQRIRLGAIESDGKGNFVAIGRNGDILYSRNGKAWKSALHGWLGSIEALAYGHAGWIAMTPDGDLPTALISLDGEDWQIQELSGLNDEVDPDFGFVFLDISPFTELTYGDGKYVGYRSGHLWWSEDGVRWKDPFELSANGFTSLEILDLEYGGGSFVAVGEKGAIWTSVDGKTWNQQAIGLTNARIESIAYGNGVWIAADVWNGVVIRSELDQEPAASRPTNLQISPAVELSWNSKEGRHYWIQSSIDLKSWTDVEGPITGSGSIMRVYQTPTDKARFWKAVER